MDKQWINGLQFFMHRSSTGRGPLKQDLLVTDLLLKPLNNKVIKKLCTRLWVLNNNNKYKFPIFINRWNL